MRSCVRVGKCVNQEKVEVCVVIKWEISGVHIMLCAGDIFCAHVAVHMYAFALCECVCVC